MAATTTLNAVFTIGSQIWEHVNYTAPFELLLVIGIGIVVLQGIVCWTHVFWFVDEPWSEVE